MTIQKLTQACDSFAKLAQQLNTKEDPKAKKAALIAAANTLYAGFRGTGSYLFSAGQAKKVFDAIAKYHSAPAYNSDREFRDVESLLTALTEGMAKVKALGLDPLEALKQRGVQNLTPTSLSTLITNLETLRDAKDFAAYRHYNIGVAGTPQTQIELDDPAPVKNDPGY